METSHTLVRGRRLDVSTLGGVRAPGLSELVYHPHPTARPPRAAGAGRFPVAPWRLLRPFFLRLSWFTLPSRTPYPCSGYPLSVRVLFRPILSSRRRDFELPLGLGGVATRVLIVLRRRVQPRSKATQTLLFIYSYSRDGQNEGPFRGTASASPPTIQRKNPDRCALTTLLLLAVFYILAGFMFLVSAPPFFLSRRSCLSSPGTRAGRRPRCSTGAAPPAARRAAVPVFYRRLPPAVVVLQFPAFSLVPPAPCSSSPSSPSFVMARFLRPAFTLGFARGVCPGWLCAPRATIVGRATARIVGYHLLTVGTLSRRAFLSYLAASTKRRTVSSRQRGAAAGLACSRHNLPRSPVPTFLLSSPLLPRSWGVRRLPLPPVVSFPLSDCASASWSSANPQGAPLATLALRDATVPSRSRRCGSSCAGAQIADRSEST